MISTMHNDSGFPPNVVNLPPAFIILLSWGRNSFARAAAKIRVFSKEPNPFLKMEMVKHHVIMKLDWDACSLPTGVHFEYGVVALKPVIVFMKAILDARFPWTGILPTSSITCKPFSTFVRIVDPNDISCFDNPWSVYLEDLEDLAITLAPVTPLHKQTRTTGFFAGIGCTTQPASFPREQLEGNSISMRNC